MSTLDRNLVATISSTGLPKSRTFSADAARGYGSTTSAINYPGFSVLINSECAQRNTDRGFAERRGARAGARVIG